MEGEGSQWTFGWMGVQVRGALLVSIDLELALWNQNYGKCSKILILIAPVGKSTENVWPLFSESTEKIKKTLLLIAKMKNRAYKLHVQCSVVKESRFDSGSQALRVILVRILIYKSQWLTAWWADIIFFTFQRRLEKNVSWLHLSTLLLQQLLIQNRSHNHDNNTVLNQTLFSAKCFN